MRNYSSSKYYTVSITYNKSNLQFSRSGVIHTVTCNMFRHKYFTGNLTRLRAVTRSLICTRCDETLLLLLAHTNANIVTAAGGALVNLSGDPDWRVTYTVQTSPKGTYLYVCVSARVRACVRLSVFVHIHFSLLFNKCIILCFLNTEHLPLLSSVRGSCLALINPFSQFDYTSIMFNFIQINIH